MKDRVSKITELEAAAGLRLLNTAWIGQDEAARSLMRKLRERAPHMCEFCFADIRRGTHSMSVCRGQSGEKIKRG